MRGQVMRRREAMRFACLCFCVGVLRYGEGRADDWKGTGILLRAESDVFCCVVSRWLSMVR